MTFHMNLVVHMNLVIIPENNYLHLQWQISHFYYISLSDFTFKSNTLIDFYIPNISNILYWKEGDIENYLNISQTDTYGLG